MRIMALDALRAGAAVLDHERRHRRAITVGALLAVERAQLHGAVCAPEFHPDVAALGTIAVVMHSARRPRPGGAPKNFPNADRKPLCDS